MSKRNAILIPAALAAVGLAAQAAAPQGWYLAGSKPSNYETGVDPSVSHESKPAAFLKAKSDGDGFGTLMQDFAAESYAGKRIRLSGVVRSDNVTRWAGLWMRVDKDKTSVSFDNMQDRAIKGTTPWRPYEIVLDVPQESTGIFFGILLDGPGTVWMSALKIEMVGTDVPVTRPAARQRKPPAQPTNLGFENR